MQKQDPEFGDFSEEIADRFRALSEVFEQLGRPEAAAELLETLIDGDSKAFGRLTDSLTLPVLNKCFWLRELIEHVIVTPAGFVEDCWLRDDLTPAELSTYLRIVVRHHQLTKLGTLASGASATVTLRDGHNVISPGPFLDELKANGLVTCKLRMTYEESIKLVLSAPELVCI